MSQDTKDLLSKICWFLIVLSAVTFIGAINVAIREIGMANTQQAFKIATAKIILRIVISPIVALASFLILRWIKRMSLPTSSGPKQPSVKSPTKHWLRLIGTLFLVFLAYSASFILIEQLVVNGLKADKATKSEINQNSANSLPVTESGWVKVSEFSDKSGKLEPGGYGINGPEFKFTSNKARLTYTVAGTNFNSDIGKYLMAFSTSVWNKRIGYPLEGSHVETMEPGSGTIYLDRSTSGDDFNTQDSYYIKVNAQDSEWKVTVEEER